MTENRDTYIPGDPTAPPTDGIPVLEDSPEGEVQGVSGAEVDTDEPIEDAIIGVRVIFDDLNPYALEHAGARFFTASEDERVVELRTAVQVLAVLIGKHAPEGVQRDLALEGLELVQMRANRAIFAPRS